MGLTLQKYLLSRRTLELLQGEVKCFTKSTRVLKAEQKWKSIDFYEFCVKLATQTVSRFFFPLWHYGFSHCATGMEGVYLNFERG